MTDVVGQQMALAWVRKHAWSRERCEELRAVALVAADGSHVSAADAALIEEAVEFMLKVRQAMRGGRLNVRGSARHWPMDEALPGAPLPSHGPHQGEDSQ